ncbi:hydrogenase 2 maturation protease [bacterium BMS3Abin07]|nr:hydrogenase 2 maturation protease [bacterium BMS3Abin07]GBE31645.1 hydrogenase 2 maturation protease [bacterium BMS3Bbin05]HDO21508.1 hydrogenase maturation protease [Nitrospirota bacterium]HDZ88387.1 hydrogenase maturation protease [Nitrospirota bacterium]
MIDNGKDIVIIGIGNILMSDDGVGVFAVQELMKRYSFPDNVELIDGGTKGLELLPFVEGKKKLLFVDAVNFDKEPGTLGELSKDEIPGYFATKLSVHQIALPDLVGAGRLLGTLPEDIHLVGIQPESTETGYGMSTQVKRSFEDLIMAVIKKLDAWGIAVSLK